MVALRLPTTAHKKTIAKGLIQGRANPAHAQKIQKAALGTANAGTRLGTLFNANTKRGIISTINHDEHTLLRVLPAFRSRLKAETYGLITGFGVNSGDNTDAANPCADGPSGTWQGGTISVNDFGRVQYDTPTLKLFELLRRDNLSSVLDFNLIGNLDTMDGIIPSATTEAGRFLNYAVNSEMKLLPLLIQERVRPQLWTGDDGNNNVGGGYKEPDGLDLQIINTRTGSGQPFENHPATSINSFVVDGNDVNITGSTFAYTDDSGTAHTNQTFLQWLELVELDLYRRINRSRLRTNVGFVMNTEMWHAVSEILPTMIFDKGVEVINANSNFTVMTNDIQRLRQEMRSNMTITLNHRTYPVFLDDGIASPSTPTRSTIYIIPLTIMNSFPATYIQYPDLSLVAQEMQGLPPEFRRLMKVKVTDGGRGVWYFVDNGDCIKLKLAMEWRPILRVPAHAGKLFDIAY